ncbi:MAG: M23 family metallopeptidase [Chloroflexota bacterium]
MWRKKYFLCCLIFLAACSPLTGPAAAEALPTLTFTPAPPLTAPPSLTPPPHTPTALLPSPTATSLPCDPHVEAFCITEGHFIFQSPILPPGNPFLDISYRYGTTQNGLREPHHGVELLGGFGTPVHAAGDGVVQFAGPDKEAVYSPWKDFYGNFVVIRHANEMYTLYAHLSRLMVEAGQEVRVGEVIGEVGQSGAATGPHLHFEVRKGSDGTDYFSTQNPELWLMPGSGNGALSIAVVNERGRFERVEVTIRSDAQTIFLETYEETFLAMEENAGLALSAGRYRISLLYGGKIHERWVEVQSGKLTKVVLVVE